MRGRLDRSVALLAACLLVTAAPAAAIGASAPAAGADVAAGSTQSSELRLHQELRLTPDRPGEIEVRLRYDVPDRVTSLTAELPDGATPVSSNGFGDSTGPTFEWDGRTPSPTVTYRLPANETGEVRGPEGADGRYRFVDVGEWALVERPRIATGWRWAGRDRVDLSRTASVDGPGAVGGSTAFLGEHRELRSSAHGQTFRLIVPEAADLEESPEAVFDAFEGASGALRVGDRDETVFAVAAPSDAVEWGARGLQVGDADLWVQDEERVDDPGDTWTHEYVHTRQSFRTTTTAAWVTEAIATYYAALLALEDGRVGFDAFARWLGLGARSSYGHAVLADPTTWDGSRPDYLKGALALGELDRRLRVQSGHERTAQAIVGGMNERDGPVNGSVFLGLVASAGGDELRSTAEEFSTTTAAPEMWGREEHERSFGPSPALIDAALAESYEIGGPFRNATASGDRAVLTAGETLSLDVRVENVGGTAGPYEVALRVDGAVEANRTGRLDPGESTTVAFDRTFADPGTYAVAVGGDRLTVDVREPAPLRIIEVGAPTTVRAGETIAVSATVRNDADVPGEREVALTLGGEVVGARTVRLDPGESRTVAIETTISEPGDHRLAVGNRTVHVRVEGAATPSPDGSTVTVRESPAGGVTVSPGPLEYVVVVAILVIALFVALGRIR